VKKVKVIDSEHGILEIHDEEEEHYATEADIRKTNFTEAKTARGLQARLLRMKERVDDDVGLLETVSPELQECLEKVELYSNLHGTKRTQKIIDSMLHSALSRANREIIRLDIKNSKIARKMIPVVVRGQEYEAPLPEEESLFSKYEKKKRQDLKEDEKAKKYNTGSGNAKDSASLV